MAFIFIGSIGLAILATIWALVKEVELRDTQDELRRYKQADMERQYKEMEERQEVALQKRKLDLYTIKKAE